MSADLRQSQSANREIRWAMLYKIYLRGGGMPALGRVFLIVETSKITLEAGRQNRVNLYGHPCILVAGRSDELLQKGLNE